MTYSNEMNVGKQFMEWIVLLDCQCACIKMNLVIQLFEIKEREKDINRENDAVIAERNDQREFD